MRRYANAGSMSRSLLMVSLLVLLLLIVGFSLSCQYQTPTTPVPSPGTSQPSPTTTPSAATITIEGFSFHLPALNVPVGTKITWTNNDSVPHTVTSRDKLFDSGSISRGVTFSYTFTQKGTFAYYCRIHPSLEAKVIVE